MAQILLEMLNYAKKKTIFCRQMLSFIEKKKKNILSALFLT